MTKSIREVATEIVDRTIENAEDATQYRIDDERFKHNLKRAMTVEVKKLLTLNNEYKKLIDEIA